MPSGQRRRFDIEAWVIDNLTSRLFGKVLRLRRADRGAPENHPWQDSSPPQLTGGQPDLSCRLPPTLI